MSARAAPLADALLAALPQTQCTRCGYPDCRAYADAIASQHEAINRCPPGGAEGVARLAALTGQAIRPLDAANGAEGPRHLALIDEAWCIGCTLCIKACPVDCIVGGPKAMHTVIESQCTGCELCIPACPVDCISLVDASPGNTGWDAWSATQADDARMRYERHRRRAEQAQADGASCRRPAAAPPPSDAPPAAPPPPASAEAERRRRIVEAAMARARAKG